MDEAPDRAAFEAALNTEYFVLQGASSASISEASSRASLYLLTLSSALVSLGFVVGLAPDVFLAFAAAALTTVFVLGWFTVIRLIDTSIANVQALRSMARIRTHFGQMHPDAPRFFPTTGDAATDATRMLALRRTSSWLYGTMASMVGAVNGVVGGAGVALLVSMLAPAWVALVAGVVAAGALFAVVTLVQQRRFTAEFPPA